MYTKTVIQEIASTLGAIKRCEGSNNTEWAIQHGKTLDWIENQFLPSGSGVDCGTKIDRVSSSERKVRLTFSFHHMDENGMYDGWTEHSAIITPSFQGVNISITGRDRNSLKEYLHETFDFALSAICFRYDETTGKTEHGYFFKDEWHPRES